MWRKIRPYVLHTRPLAKPIVILHLTTGFILANGFSIGFRGVLLLFFAWFVWAFLLDGGNLAFNSFYDKDKRDIGFLDNPPKVPKYLLHFSLALFIIGFILSYFINIKFFIAYTIFFVLAIFYSHPSIRLKSKIGFDAFTNAIGYGVLTLYAGWALTSKSLNMTFILIAIAAFLAFLGGYPLTTLYQYDRDKRKGDRILTLFLGKRGSLLFSFILIMLSFLLLIYIILKGYLPYYSFLVLLSAIYGSKIFFDWYSRMDRIDMKKQMYKAYRLWALTDILLIISLLI